MSSGRIEIFLKFFMREEVTESEEDFFDYLDSYLTKEFQSLPLFILSFPIQKKGEVNYTRLHWNKK